MKKRVKNITTPDELDRNLQYSSPITWMILSFAVVLLIGFFLWSFIYKFNLKITGSANIENGIAILHINETKLNELKEGQKVYISGQEGVILSFNNKQPVVSSFALDDGEYDYYIVLKEMRPIDFLLDK